MILRESDRELIKIFLHQKSLKLFFVGIIISFAFSISVILSTIGLMDGFLHSLKLSLKSYSSDALLFNRYGFFEDTQVLKDIFYTKGALATSPYLQTESFIIQNDEAKGVLVKGIEPKSYQEVSGLNLDLTESEVALGSVLAQNLNSRVGDKVTLTFIGDNQNPKLQNFTVKQVIEHGMYEIDERIAYIHRRPMAQFLGAGKEVNMMAIKVLDNQKGVVDPNAIDDIRKFIADIPGNLGPGFVLKPFWSDYLHLIEAVEIEKYTIGIILQLIVLISIFNILAFMIFLNEKKAKEIFLFQALGASRGQMVKVWSYILFSIWVISCLVSIAFTASFNWGLKVIPLFKLPGKIYNIDHLFLKLDFIDYMFVFVLAFVWLAVLSLAGGYRLKKANVLSKLRQRFT